MEMRINNLQMDMIRVELGVANAHHQVQHVKDEVCMELSERIRMNFLDLQATIEAVEEQLRECCDRIQHLSSWPIFQFFFRQLPAQLSTLLSTFLLRIIQENNEATMNCYDCLFYEPTTTNYTRQTTRWVLQRHPGTTYPSSSPLQRTPWDLLGCYRHAHRQSSHIRRPNSLHGTHP